MSFQKSLGRLRTKAVGDHFKRRDDRRGKKLSARGRTPVDQGSGLRLGLLEPRILMSASPLTVVADPTIAQNLNLGTGTLDFNAMSSTKLIGSSIDGVAGTLSTSSTSMTLANSNSASNLGADRGPLARISIAMPEIASAGEGRRRSIAIGCRTR